MTIYPTTRIALLVAAAALVTFLTAPNICAATITVTTAANQTGGGPTDCSLNEAIRAANTDAAFGGCPAGDPAPTVDSIVFAIPGTGVKTITTNSSLPEITTPMIIDGTTQSGASCTTPGGLTIELVAAGSATYGIRINGAAGSTIKGLVIHGFPSAGLDIRGGSTGNTVVCNYIGTDVTGTAALPNGLTGIQIFNASNNLIGGTTAADRNLISGNSGAGIAITRDTGLASGNRIVGNYIGTNINGTAAVGNLSYGVSVAGCDDTVIGDETAGAGNVISGNDGRGIQITTLSTLVSHNTTIKGNLIGLRVNGAARLRNAGEGIALTGALNTQIGGTAPLARNIISGNSQGIVLYTGSANNVIENNYVGTDVTGTVDIGNVGTGITVVDSSSNLIGGTTAASRNVISGNNAEGIVIFDNGSFAAGNQILGNYVGTDVTGMVALGNSTEGITVAGADNTIIGDDVVGGGNVISGNTSYGIWISSNGTVVAQNCMIQNNYIGVDVAGTSALANNRGIQMQTALNTTIGGPTPLARNVISGNTREGLFIIGNSAAGLIQGNSIGINANGNGVIPNGGAGILLQGSLTSGFRISQNSIWSNAGLGIDLNGNGVSINDTDDGDTGPNDMQNFPVLTLANAGFNTTQIAGTFNSRASRSYRLEFFLSPTADTTGYGQGRFYLGATDVVTDSSNNATFNVSLPVGSTGGWFVTATATDLTTNDTSEFCQARALAGPTAASATLTGRVLDPNGRPVVKAQVVLTDSTGAVRRTLSSPFGYYNFTDLPAAQLVVITVSGKGLVFTPIALTLAGQESNIDIVGAAEP